MRKLLTENITLKISAVLISIFLWFFVTSRGQSEINFEVPLEYKNIPADMGIVNGGVKNVTVTVRGQERTMKNLKASDVRVYVDLEKAKNGEETFYLKTDDVKLPYSLSATNVVPSSVRIKLDETVSMAVQVKPVLSGEPESRFFVSSIKVDPKNVALKGLKSEVRRLRVVKTEVLDITDLNKTLTQEASIDTGGANVSPEPGTVKVTIYITEKKK